MLPPVICLTGRRSSSDGQVIVDRMFFDLYWVDDNLMTTDVGRKLHILNLALNLALMVIYKNIIYAFDWTYSMNTIHDPKAWILPEKTDEKRVPSRIHFTRTAIFDYV